MSYLSHTAADRARMMEAIGVRGAEDLFSAIPAELRRSRLDMPPGLSEQDVRSYVAALSDRNRPLGSHSFLGAGSYQHFIPAAVRALAGRAEFATSYTPYQAEVSQGTLQAIFEFQTAICELTGLDVANASMYDGPSAAAEAAFLALRQTRRDGILLSGGLHPETQAVVKTYASGPGLPVDIVPLDPATGRTPSPLPGLLSGIGAVLVQQPNFFGVVEDLAPLVEAAHANGALLVVSQDPVTLGVLEAPGALGADIAVGDVQVFGNPMSFGGPSAGYLACRQDYLHQLPGRLAGLTVDADGRPCYCLALQAREQHIRRAKATSNICSNQALCALAATIHLALLGPVGLRELSEVCLRRAHYLQAELVRAEPSGQPSVQAAFTSPFFHEFTLRLPGDAAAFAAAMSTRGVDAGVPLGRFDPEYSNMLLVAVTESNPPEAIEDYIRVARDVLAKGAV